MGTPHSGHRQSYINREWTPLIWAQSYLTMTLEGSRGEERGWSLLASSIRGHIWLRMSHQGWVTGIHMNTTHLTEEVSFSNRYQSGDCNSRLKVFGVEGAGRSSLGRGGLLSRCHWYAVSGWGTKPWKYDLREFGFSSFRLFEAGICPTAAVAGFYSLCSSLVLMHPIPNYKACSRITHGACSTHKTLAVEDKSEEEQ